MMLFRRKEAPWEVVDSRSVDPVPTYYEDEDLDLVAVKDGNIRRTYVLALKQHDSRTRNDLHKAVVFARDQLMQEAKKSGYNTLLLESWSLTLFRKAQAYRIEVEYSGRPARSLNKVPHRPPPFMAVLQTQY